VFVSSGPGRIGSRYVKCLYRQYPDARFRHPMTRPADEAHLGMLGPVIRAEVGDTIKVVFRNTCPFPASMHPHGVFYDKSSEGAPYADGTRKAAKLDDAVRTGHRHTYLWEVPGRAGPGPGDGSSVMWMYHSHTDEVADTYAGLIGPMVVTARGQARPDRSPMDVDRLHRADHVRWYVMCMGTEVDLHTPHWHGNDVVVNGMRMDVVSLLPASMVTADMVPDDKGIWLFHCHVNDHLSAGMLARYRVL